MAKFSFFLWKNVLQKKWEKSNIYDKTYIYKDGMSFNGIGDCLDCYVLYIIQMKFNGIYANYKYNNFNFFDKNCVRTM